MIVQFLIGVGAVIAIIAAFLAVAVVLGLVDTAWPQFFPVTWDIVKLLAIIGMLLGPTVVGIYQLGGWIMS